MVYCWIPSYALKGICGIIGGFSSVCNCLFHLFHMVAPPSMNLSLKNSNVIFLVNILKVANTIQFHFQLTLNQKKVFFYFNVFYFITPQKSGL